MHKPSYTLDHKARQGLFPLFFFGKRRPQFFAPAIQPKLTVNRPGDKYEREADVVADRVMGNRTPDKILPVLQRKPEGEGNAVDPQVAASLQSGKGGGNPIAKDNRKWIEDRIGADFRSVKVHTDTPAVQLSRKLNAQAFTHGSDIYFNEGKYAPNTNEGNRLLAHELTHIVQQSQSGAAAEVIQRDETTAPAPGAEENSFDFDFDVLPPSLKFTIGRWMLDANTGSTELQFSQNLLRYRLGYDYGGDIFAGFNAPGFGTRLGFNPGSGAASFSLRQDQFRFGSSVNPMAGSVGLNLGYGAPLLPMPWDLQAPVEGGWAGISSIMGDLGNLQNPMSFYQSHSDDVDGVMGAVRALQPLADEDRARFGAGLKFNYNPDSGVLIYGGMQWFF